MSHIISIGTKNNSESSANWHEHSFWEFIYYTDGYGSFQCGKKILTFHPHMLICVPPHQGHTEFCDGRFSNIFFLLDAPLELPEQIRQYEDHVMHEIEGLMTLMRFQYYRRLPDSVRICDKIVDLIIALIHSKPPLDDTESFVDLAESTIIAKLSDPAFDVNSIFEDIPMSKVYFASLFKKRTGMSPLEYLTDRRIENAKDLLLARSVSHLSVGEIALLSGFDDRYYFSRVFKKRTGLSPLNWIKIQSETDK